MSAKPKNSKQRPIAAIYARTSKEFRNVEKVSIEQQIESGHELAEREGYQVPPEFVFVDRDISGQKPPRQLLPLEEFPQNPEKLNRKIRPALTKLIELAQSGKIDVIIVRKTNRLARRSKLGFDIYDLVLNPRKTHGKQIEIKGTHENIPTQDGSTGKFILGMNLLLSEYELSNIQSNIKAAKRYSKNNGLPMTGVSRLLGYSESPDNPKKAVVNPEESMAVREIFRLYTEEQLSLVKVAEVMNQKYPHLSKRWHISQVRKKLVNPSYIGKAYNEDGEIIDSQVYPAIISFEDWMTTQARVTQRKAVKTHGRTKRHLLTQMLTYTMTNKSLCIAYARRNGKHSFDFYQTKRTKTYIPIVPEHLWDRWAEAWLAPAKVKRVNKVSNEKVLELELKLDRLEKNLRDLEQMVEEGEMPVTDLNKFRPPILKNISITQSQIKELAVAAEASGFTEIPWGDMSIDERREKLFRIVKKILVNDKGVLVEFKPGTELDFFEKGYDQTFGLMFFPWIKERLPDVNGRLRMQNSLGGHSIAMQEYLLDGTDWGHANGDDGYFRVWGPSYDLDEENYRVKI
jgi:DNA invertase Pin-like site-specific DNA recombinase